MSCPTEEAGVFPPLQGMHNNDGTVTSVLADFDVWIFIVSFINSTQNWIKKILKMGAGATKGFSGLSYMEKDT